MRLKEDTSSWRAGGVKRRDKRRAKDEDRDRPQQFTRKDTKHWCGGKIGREHVRENGPVKYLNSYHSWFEVVCKKCNKKLDWVWVNKREGGE